jgi:hypothetical protein
MHQMLKHVTQNRTDDLTARFFFFLIWVINQLDAQNFCFTISLLHASTCFEHHVLIIRTSKLHYTASGIITPIGVMIGCTMQFLPPDDEHMVLETCRGMKWTYYKTKFCASSWLITKIKKVFLKVLFTYTMWRRLDICHTFSDGFVL